MKTYDKPQVSVLDVDLENVILAGSNDPSNPDPLPQPTPGDYNEGNIDLAPVVGGPLLDEE